LNPETSGISADKVAVPSFKETVVVVVVGANSVVDAPTVMVGRIPERMKVVVTTICFLNKLKTYTGCIIFPSVSISIHIIRGIGYVHSATWESIQRTL
jgi:hypothetical protein